MAQLNGMRTTANQASATVKQHMDDAIDMLRVDDVPLQQRFSSSPVNNLKYEWLDEDLDTQSIQVTATSATSSTSVTVSDASGVRVRDVYKKRDAASEETTPGSGLQVEVSAVNYTTNVLTLAARPGFGSTDVQLVNGDVLDLIGQVPKEGEEPQNARDLDPNARFNYCERFQEHVQASRTAQKHEQWGITNPLERAKQRKFKELAIRFERSLIHSRRQKSTDGTQYQMGGLLYFIQTNFVSGVKVNMASLINDLLRKSYNVGGMPSFLVVSPSFKRVFSELNASLVHEDHVDTVIGRTKTRFTSDFGDVEVWMDRHMPTKTAIAVQPEYVTIQNYDEWFYEDLAKTGDADHGHIVAEKGLKVKNEKAHGVLVVTDLS